jgi:hypothetical protein
MMLMRSGRLHAYETSAQAQQTKTWAMTRRQRTIAAVLPLTSAGLPCAAATAHNISSLPLSVHHQ